MAVMIPEKPHDFDPRSREGLMFDCLEKLPEDYYVFHSFKIVTVNDDMIHESETDFVVFNPNKGILCIEAKAGRVTCDLGVWKYGSGIVMKHESPYRQAYTNKWKISEYVKKIGLEYLLDRCKLMHAVWFPSVGKQYFESVQLPADADIELTLTADSFDNIEEEISRIFDKKLPRGIETKLNSNDVKAILGRVLAPTFDLVSLADMRMDHKRQVFKKMLKEQVALLDYLEEQNSAVINGLAGTGKTVMAIEKAKRHADSGDSVLFLCYNVFLKEHLQQAYAHENIHFYTIDGLACKLCNTPTPNYDRLKDTLEEMYVENNFPYQHIVIDEGQDFGKDRINDVSIIELLKANVIDDEDKNGTFYVFYDKNQMVQSKQLPEYIVDADCKLTLYRNCRNTENIALTSLRLLGSDKKPKVFEGAIVGESPEMYFADNTEKTVATINSLIDKAWESGYKDIQILTCKTESKSIIADECSTGVYSYKAKKIPFTTCRKYKGLEADVIIMVDLDNDVFTDNAEQIMYVGSSRARFNLSLVANINEEACVSMLEKLSIKKSRKPSKAFAALYNAKFKSLDI